MAQVLNIMSAHGEDQDAEDADEDDCVMKFMTTVRMPTVAARCWDPVADATFC